MSVKARLFCVVTALAFSACSGGGSAPPVQQGSISGNAPGTTNAAGSAIPPQYTLTDLGTGLPGSPGLVPRRVNNNGVVVGTASFPILGGGLPSCQPSSCGPALAWINKNGSTQALPLPAFGASTFADDVNDAGTVSGGYLTTTEFAVLWKSDGSTLNLGTGTFGATGGAEAVSISNSGKIAGNSFDNATGATVPSFFDEKGGATAPCGSSVQGLFESVNDAGVGVGLSFLSAGGTAAMSCPPFSVIENPSDPTFHNFAWDINNRGDIVGRLTLNNIAIFHPFLLRSGTTTDLGTLFPGTSTAVGAAFGINNFGVIVGWSGEVAGTGGPSPIAPVNPRAFVWANGKMVDLNTLLPASCANWRLVVAEDINDRGQIVASAFVGGFPGGVEHAVLLTPVK